MHIGSAMNIAFFSHYFSPEIGAPSARIHDLARQWLLLNHNTQVVTCFPNHPTGILYPGYKLKRYMNEKIDGITVHRNWTYITPNKGIVKRTLGHLSLLPSSLVNTLPHLSPRPNVAIGSSPTLFAVIAALMSARKYRIPLVMEVRDLWPAIFVELGILKSRALIFILERLEMALYRSAQSIITVTRAFRNNLTLRGISPEKVFVVPNGADVEFWKPLSKPQRLLNQLGLQNKTVVLYIGAHGISQALSKVLEAAEILRNENDLVFLFVGEGAEKELLLKRAAEAHLTNVKFHEPVDKAGVRDFYALSDICLVPLRNIPLFKNFIPSKMFEIMAMRRAIVGSVSGESAEILKDSQGAIVVEPEDSGAMANAILELYHQVDRRDKLGINALDYVHRNYSRQRLANHYLDILRTTAQSYSARTQ
jgi:hypothetical protein